MAEEKTTQEEYQRDEWYNDPDPKVITRKKVDKLFSGDDGYPDEEYLQDLIMGVSGGGPVALSKAVKKALAPAAKKTGTVVTRQMKKFLNRYYYGTTKTKTNGGDWKYIKGSKTAEKIGDFLTDKTPSAATIEAVKYGKDIAIKDLAGSGGFQRYINTVPEMDFDISRKALTAIEKTFNTLIRTRIQDTKSIKMDVIESLEMKAGGYALARGDNPVIALREGLIKKGPRWTQEFAKSTGVHESTHIGGLQPVRAFNEMQIMAEQSGLDLNTEEGKKALKWLDDTFFGNTTYGEVELGKNWQHYYGEQLKPFLNKGKKITPVDGKYYNTSNPLHRQKYLLQPSELTARMSEIRRLRSMKNPNKEEIAMLKRKEARELKLMSKKGLDYAVNTLWSLAPMAPFLSMDKAKEGPKE